MTFFVLFYSAVENNKVCCRTLGSELSVLRGRDDILEINLTYQGFWLHLRHILLRNIMAILCNPVFLENSKFDLLFKRPYRQTYSDKSAYFWGCK